jgi:glutathione S-transferase
MSRKLYDLAGADPERRFSPYCWRAKLALAHKGLEVETIPWRFTERDMIAFSGQGRVPVLVDGDEVVSDSWSIANYLEDTYPDQPSLFGGEGGRALARFVNSWADAVQLAGMIRMVVADIHAHVHEKDKDYFRESREKRFGATLEQVAADREQRLPVFRQSLDPLRLTLRAQPFLCGEASAYADYIVFGGFQWARCISAFKLLEPDDPVAQWRERMLQSHGGMPARAVGYAA